MEIEIVWETLSEILSSKEFSSTLRPRWSYCGDEKVISNPTSAEIIHITCNITDTHST